MVPFEMIRRDPDAFQVNLTGFVRFFAVIAQNTDQAGAPGNDTLLVNQWFVADRVYR